MKKLHLWVGIGCLLLLMSVWLPNHTGGVAASLPTSAKIDPALLTQLAHSNTGQVRFIVYLKAQADLASLRSMSPATEARGEHVYRRLRQTADAAQAEMLGYLQRQQATGHVSACRSLWIINGVAVTGDRETLNELAQRSEVARIVTDHYRQWLEGHAAPPPQVVTVTAVVVTANPTFIPTEPPSPPSPPPPDPSVGIAWNIKQIHADEVWHQLGINGQGIVVANMDTGVMYTHPALMRQYRGAQPDGTFNHNYNWYDETSSYITAPYDDHGHGTHTMGTMVGDDGQGNVVGVAPGARWIAVKILNGWGMGWDSDIHAGFQWLLAPTDLRGQNPDPSRAPQVVNNSWGKRVADDPVFRQDVQALIAAGIIPVFAAGNAGPAAGTIKAPASYPESWAVGATDAQDQIADYSSRGPSPYTTATKPEFSAPGDGVLSCWSNGAYAPDSGTSMAAPHLAGVVALLLQANPCLTPDEIKNDILQTSLDLGDPGPDNVYGWGRIDAFAAVIPYAAHGQLIGQVRNEAGKGLPYVALSVRPQQGGRPLERTTNAQGVYSYTLPAGTYDMHLRLYGYKPLTVTGVVITDGLTTRRDVTMTTAPTYPLQGVISDLVTGAPLAAKVTVLDTPLSPVLSDPTTGAYHLTIVEGSYKLKVAKVGYKTLWPAISVTGPLTRNFALQPLPAVLLVDDDDGAPYEHFYTQTLTSLGESYDYWDTQWGVPTLERLEQYPIVIWWNGDHNYLQPQMENVLADYLNGGGQLFLSSRAYVYRGEQKWFVRDYLRTYYHWNTMVLSITGVAGDPVGAWLGPFSLHYPDDNAGVTIVNAYPEAHVAFASENSPWGGVATTYFNRLYKYRTVFFSVPFEALQPADEVPVLRRILTWFRSPRDVVSLQGTIRSARHDTPLAYATVKADGSRDQQMAQSSPAGEYALRLLPGTYDITVAADGYLPRTWAGVVLTGDRVISRDFALEPQVVFTPTAISLTLTAGQQATRFFTITNRGGSVLRYHLNAEETSFVPYTTTTRTPRQISAPRLDIPLSVLSPTIDGVFSPGEWADAAVVTATDNYAPSGDVFGQIYTKQAGGDLFILMDCTRSRRMRAAYSSDISFDFGHDGTHDGSITVWTRDNVLGTHLDFPAQVRGGWGSSPRLDAVHWIVEYKIPLRGLQIGPGMYFGVHFSMSGDSSGQLGRGPQGGYAYSGEWYNATTRFDYAYPRDWAVAYLPEHSLPWLTMSPITETITAPASQGITVHLDAAIAQPGTHHVRVQVYSEDHHTVLISPTIPLTLTVLPSPTMISLAGTVADKRTDQPLAATVTADNGAAVPSDPANGAYQLWLNPGSWHLTVTAPRHLSVTVGLSLTAQSSHVPLNFSLWPDAPQIVPPSPLSITVMAGQQVTQLLRLENRGVRELQAQLYELAEGTLPTTTMAAALTLPRRWSDSTPHRPSARRMRQPAEVTFPLPETLDPFLFDPRGDAKGVDLVRAEAAVRDPGWNDEPSALDLRLVFAPDTDLQGVVGYVFLDTDRNPHTGRAPQVRTGLSTQDIGYDVLLDLFNLVSGQVDVWRADGRYLGTVASAYGENSVELRVPLSLLGDSDKMDAALALGTLSGAAEWAPAQGHGVIGVGLPWLVEETLTPQVAAQGCTTLTLHYSAVDVQPGTYTGRLAVGSNDVLSPVVYIPLRMTVKPAATMGRLTGRVYGQFDGYGVSARVITPEGWYTTTARDGHYTLWLEPGTRTVRAQIWPPATTISRTVTVSIVTGETREQDFALPWTQTYLPLLLRNFESGG